MGDNVDINASILSNISDTPSIITADTDSLDLKINIQTDRQLPENAEIILTAHDIFSRRTKVLPDAFPELSSPIPDDIHLHIAPDQFSLSPGVWHLLVDVMCGEKTLAGAHPGSTDIYVRDSSESRLFSEVSYVLARAEYAFEREYGAYFPAYHKRIPHTIDPFSDQDASEFQNRFVRSDAVTAQSIHDAGIGAILAASAYRDMEYPDRYTYCEEAVARFIRVLLELMAHDDGQLYDLSGIEDNRSCTHCDVESNATALAFLAQSYFYFIQDPINNKDYSRYILSHSKPIFKALLNQYQALLEAKSVVPMGLDARLLYGLASYCIAHKNEHGQYYSPQAHNTLLDGLKRLTNRLQENLPSSQLNPDETIYSFYALLLMQHMCEHLADRNDKALSLLSETTDVLHLIKASIFHPESAKKSSTIVQMPGNLFGTLYVALQGYSHSLDDPFQLEHLPEYLPRELEPETTLLADLNATGAELYFCPEYQESAPPRWLQMIFEA